MRKRIVLATLILLFVPLGMKAQGNATGMNGTTENGFPRQIDRKALVRRNNPHTTFVGRQQFLLGDSKNTIYTDATALQTFVADTAWHVNIGLNLPDTTHILQLNMTLDRWNGKADSRFRHNNQYFHVETVCAPHGPSVAWGYQRWPSIATRITSDSVFEVVFRPIKGTSFELSDLKKHAVITIVDGNKNVFYTIVWRGNASIKKKDNVVVLRCKGDKVKSEGHTKTNYSVDITMNRVQSMPSDWFFNNTYVTPFTEYAVRTATGWNTFWLETGIADFSAEKSPEARLVEQRLVETLYNITSATPDDWWMQTPLTAYGFAKQIVPDMRRITKEHPEQLWQRPELIATALLTLRAYTLPEVIERFSLNSDEVTALSTTVLNAFNLYVAKAAELLASGQTTAPDCLDREQLLLVAQRWNETCDSLSNNIERQVLLVYPDSLANTDRLKATASSTVLFHLPLTVDLASMPVLSTEQQHLLLLSVAARQWPYEWKVATENILPLP